MKTKNASQTWKFWLVISLKIKQYWSWALLCLGARPETFHSWEESFPNKLHLAFCVNNSMFLLSGSFDKKFLSFFPKKSGLGHLGKIFEHYLHGWSSRFQEVESDYFFVWGKEAVSYMVIKKMVFLTREASQIAYFNQKISRVRNAEKLLAVNSHPNYKLKKKRYSLYQISIPFLYPNIPISHI